MVSALRATSFALLVAAVLVLGTALPVHAATPLTSQQLATQPKGITLSPPLQNLILGSGLTEAHINITLTNKSGKDVATNISLVDFQALDAFGGVTLDQVDTPVTKYSLAHWMSLPNGPSLTIPNNTTATVPVNISNTKDLAPGGHYGAVIFSLDTVGSGTNGVSLKQRLVSLLFIDKSGGDVPGLQLDSFTPNTLHTIPQDVTMMFKGTGNVHVVPRGFITVTDAHDKLIAKGIINPESTIVMPGAERQFVSILQPVNSASSTGKFTLTVHYRYDGTENFATKSLTFKLGLFSRPTVIIAAAALVIIVVVVLRFRSRRKHRFYSLKS